MNARQILACLLLLANRQPMIETLTGPRKLVLVDVAIATTSLPEVEYRKALEDRIGTPAESFSLLKKGLIDSPYHPFIQAVYASYGGHRPLVISPDMIWLMICQGFAQHIDQNVETLRKKIVSFSGIKEIQVRRDDFIKGKLDNPWEEVFPDFARQVKKEIGPDLYDLINAHFSTTGNKEKAAFELSLMDVTKHYFSVSFITICGIPYIILEGTAEDWRSIVTKTEMLRLYELDWWVDELLPILKQFVGAAEGHFDRKFWNRMFQNKQVREGCSLVPGVNGWIVKFFPYLSRWNNKPRINPFLKQLPSREGGINLKDFRDGLAKVDFKWLYRGHKFDMQFLAGFVGVSQDTATKALRPEIGWVVREVDIARSDSSRTGWRK